MPTEAKELFDDMNEKVKEIQEDIQEEANKANVGSRAVALNLYAGGALVALVAAGAIAL